MPESLYPQPSKDPARTRRDLAPEIEEAFQQFSKAVFREGSQCHRNAAVAVFSYPAGAM